MRAPTISAVLAVYNDEDYVAEALEAILGQSHAPEEVIVVDDGSTDGTPEVLARFRRKIRVVRQRNGGHAAGFNRAFREARCDYIARCDSDDIWESDKLARQVEALRAHPDVDILCGAARTFGRSEQLFASAPGSGVLDRRSFARLLYRRNRICVSSVMIRRSCFERLGPFTEELISEDYEYWMRALKRGAIFFYDPHTLVKYRLHDANMSSNRVRNNRAMLLAHRWHADLPEDRVLVRAVFAADHFTLGRLLVDEERSAEARREFVASLRQRPGLRALAWALLTSMPDCYRRPLAGASVSVKRALFPPDTARTWTNA